MSHTILQSVPAGQRVGIAFSAAGVHAMAGSAGAAAAAVPANDCFTAVNLGNRMPGLGRALPTADVGYPVA